MQTNCHGAVFKTYHRLYVMSHTKLCGGKLHFDGSRQYCRNSNAVTMALVQSCTKSSISLCFILPACTTSHQRHTSPYGRALSDVKRCRAMKLSSWRPGIYLLVKYTMVNIDPFACTWCVFEQKNNILPILLEYILDLWRLQCLLNLNTKLAKYRDSFYLL